MKEFYFSQFEDRQPEPPLQHSKVLEFFWQIAASMAVGLGFWYIVWRWTHSLNMDALWFSVPVVTAETLSMIGMVLYFHNLWSTNDLDAGPAPENRSEVIVDQADRSISVDVFLPTFNEDPELTRYSIRAAKALRYPHEIDIRVHVLDDGNRKSMKKVAQEEQVYYLTRESNLGYKAGNLRNAMEQTDGDFIVILDADTRVFPTFLENTLGYFRDQDVAWVQSPQWFYDVPEGEHLSPLMKRKFGRFFGWFGAGVEKIIGPVKFGEDPFVSDAKLFYDVILRRRNRVNASFCCGAGSIHRREAVMEGALRAYSKQISKFVDEFSSYEKCQKTKEEMKQKLVSEFAVSTELMPYMFHVSEDIYTSILLHSESERNWKSILHPRVETKMLSPLDMKSWAMQRFKYAGGTLDILINANPLFREGMSLSQKLMYAMTFWSYLSPLWVCVFLAAPIISLFTGIAPVSSYSWVFFAHLIPFLVVHELASALGTWGVNNSKGKMLNLAFFSFNLQALWTVLRGREIRFNVTPKARSRDNFIHLVSPQIAVFSLSILAILYGLINHLIDPSPQQLTALVVNAFWAGLNAYAMTVLISAALWKPSEDKKDIDVKKRRNFWRTV